MGFQPSECVAFEDSPNGIKSAKEAGLRVIGLSAMHGSEKLGEPTESCLISGELRLKPFFLAGLTFFGEGPSFDFL